VKEISRKELKAIVGTTKQ